MAKQIGISVVFFLMENEKWDFETDQPKLYGLKYYIASGEERTRYNCRKHVKVLHELKQRTESTHSTRGKYDRAIKGLFPIFDHDTQEFRSIGAAHIVYFRNHGSKEWLSIKN